MTTKENIVLLVGGDTVPTSTNAALFEVADVEELLGKGIVEEFQGADITVLNLETPLVDELSPIKKHGPNLSASTKSIAFFEKLKISALCLANNHVMDQGKAGYESTVKTLSKARIPYFGVGDSLNDCVRYLILESKHKKIGLYACVEHEFSIAQENHPGANPFNPLVVFDDVRKLSEECDYVVVLYHGGKEHYRYPSPELQQVCRKFAEAGANLVVCQHSHCVGCEETWNGSSIVYGQGNFVFDRSESEYWQTSLLLKITINSKGSDISFIPLEKQGRVVRKASDDSSSEILSKFEKRSEEILMPGFVERQYTALSKEVINQYLRGCLPGSSSIWFRGLNKISGGKLLRHRARKINYTALLNSVECEAHRELFIKGLHELAFSRD